MTGLIHRTRTRTPNRDGEALPFFTESEHYPQVLQDDLTTEARQPRTRPSPSPPSEAERELHNLTHMPFRAWCPICVSSRGLPTQHRQVYDRKPRIQVDYGFITPKEGKQVTIRYAIGVATGLTMSCGVPTKGPIDYAVNELRRFALEAGRTAGKLHIDQASSINALVNVAAAKLGMGVQMSPGYYKQSQGVVERWHRELWGHTRVLKATMESNYGLELDATHPLITWAIKHASWIYNRFQLHQDGKTSYERRWNHNYSRPLCEFGETILFRSSHHPNHKAESAWDYGLWLGKCTRSDEHFVGTATGVYRTRTIRRLPATDRYDRALFDKVTSTPLADRWCRQDSNSVFRTTDEFHGADHQRDYRGSGVSPGTTTGAIGAPRGSTTAARRAHSPSEHSSDNARKFRRPPPTPRCLRPLATYRASRG